MLCNAFIFKPWVAVGDCYVEIVSQVKRKNDRFPWHRGIQKHDVMAKVMRKERNYNVCCHSTMSVISKKRLCVCAVYLQLSRTCSPQIQSCSHLKSTDHVTNIRKVNVIIKSSIVIMLVSPTFWQHSQKPV